MNEELKTRKRMPKRMRPPMHPAWQSGQDAAEEPQGLKVEIADLRHLSRRVSAKADETDVQKDLIRAVEATGKSYMRLATLMKIDRMLGSEGDTVMAALNQALKEVMEKLEEKNRPG